MEGDADSPKPAAVVKVLSSAKDLEEIASWGSIYDTAYASQNAVNDDPTLNFSGYDNSFTPRIPHELHVVHEWVERTCDRVLALQPRRVVELGCGNGMILLRCAGATERYAACDLSEQAMEYVDRTLRMPKFRHLHANNIVVTSLGGAHESLKFAHETLDTIVCNGVSMYFPSATYLLECIQNALAALQPGGKFFLGDVRCNSLLHHFHAACQLAQAPDDLPVSELLLRINKGVRFEKELLVDPDFFLALAGRLPGLAAVDLDIKRGEFHSEFSMFRYDVTFTKDGGPAAVAKKKPVAYELLPYDAARHSAKNLTATLERDQPNVLALSGLVDARLAQLDCLVQKVKTGTVASKTNGDLLAEIAEAATALAPVEPEAMYRLGEAAGYTTTLFWPPGQPAVFDVLFVRNAAFPTADSRAAVEPLALAAARRQWGTRKGDMVVPQKLLHTDYELYTNRGQLANGSAGLDDGRRTLTSTQVREIPLSTLNRLNDIIRVRTWFEFGSPSLNVPCVPVDWWCFLCLLRALTHHLARAFAGGGVEGGGARHHAGVHGAVGVRGPDAHADDVQWQGGSQGAA